MQFRDLYCRQFSRSEDSWKAFPSIARFSQDFFLGISFIHAGLSNSAILQGSGCNCTDALRRQAFSNLTSALEGDEDISVAGDADAACKYGGSVPHGFISKLLFIFSLKLLGSLFFCKRLSEVILLNIMGFFISKGTLLGSALHHPQLQGHKLLVRQLRGKYLRHSVHFTLLFSAGAQSGPYVGLTIIGMIGGSLITGLAMYLFYRKRVGVR